MIESKTMYETSDRKLFEDEKKARAHDLDRVREAIDAKLKFMAEGGRWTASERFELVLKMVPDYETAIALTNALNKILF